MTTQPQADPMVAVLDTITASRSVLAAVTTTEEGRFLRCMRSVLQEQDRRGAERAKKRTAEGRATEYDLPDRFRGNLYYWNRVRGLTKLVGVDQRGGPEGPVPIPEWNDPSDGSGGSTENIDNVFLYMRYQSGRRDARQERAIYVLADYGPVLEPTPGQHNHDEIRRLRDLIFDMKNKPVNILVVGPRWPTIPELQDDVHVEEMPLPDRDVTRARVEVHRRAATATGEIAVDLDEEATEAVVTALLGLSENQIDRVLSRAMRRSGFTARMIEEIIGQKEQLIQAIGCLEYIRPLDVAEAGGYRPVLRLLKNVSRSRKEKYARRKARLKGVIFTGIAGTGKGWWARISGGVRGVPTIRLDMGAAMGSLVGETENNVAQALKVVESLGDCNLWIDEFEKAVGGMESSNQTDGGTTARAVAKLLTWMSEHEECFVIACANDISKLAPEIIRGGRFDEKLFFDLPGAADLEAILTVHCKKREVDPTGFDLQKVVGALAAKQFVAAEVEVVVKKAILAAISRSEEEGGDDADPSTEDFLEAIRRYTPLAKMNADVVEAQRRYARAYSFESASGGETLVPGPGDTVPKPKLRLPVVEDDVDLSRLN